MYRAYGTLYLSQLCSGMNSGVSRADGTVFKEYNHNPIEASGVATVKNCNTGFKPGARNMKKV